MMSATEDIKRLTQTVREQAQAQREEILDAAQAKASGIQSRAQSEAAEREEELIQAGLSNVQRARKRIVSQAQLRLRGEYSQKQAIILEEILDEVQERLLALRGGDDYSKFLWQMISEALQDEEAKGGRVRIYLNREDLQGHREELLRLLSGKFELSSKEIELSDADLLGGVIVEFPDRRLQVDTSLERLLTELRPWIGELVGERVFERYARDEEGENG